MTFPLLIPLFLIWLGVVIFLRRFRVWLFYYVLGAVGCAYWLILVFGSVLGLEITLAHTVAWTVHIIANLAGIPTRIFEGSPGLLLVLVIAQKIGWTALHVGVESSGLLEIGVLTSLLLFYPGWSILRRAQMIGIGGVAIWLTNIVRMLVIVVMLNRFGKEALVLAHMYVGKAVFFLLAIGIFWMLITFATLRDLEKRSKETQAAW
jgi:exosortase family protein XrtG